MKKVFLSLLSLILVASSSFAQTSATSTDKMYKHSGDVLDVKIIKVGETTITYKYPGEDAEQTIGKLAINKIVYGSGHRRNY